jgi:hypothetical protein
LRSSPLPPATFVILTSSIDTRAADHRDHLAIYIAEWLDAYMAATSGDRDAIVKVAGIVLDERAARAGPAERAAYESRNLHAPRLWRSACDDRQRLEF